MSQAVELARAAIERRGECTSCKKGSPHATVGRWRRANGRRSPKPERTTAFEVAYRPFWAIVDIDNEISQAAEWTMIGAAAPGAHLDDVCRASLRCRPLHGPG